jgi:hypothetical protein
MFLVLPPDFFIDVSHRFKKIKEPVNLPKYPRDSFTAQQRSPLSLPSSSPSGAAPLAAEFLARDAAPLASSSTSSPSPDTGRRLPLTERAQPSRSTIPPQESTSPITYNWPPVTKFVSSSGLSCVPVMICV